MRRTLTALLVALALALAAAVAPAPPRAAAQGTNAAQGNPSTKVWVNTSSGVYHCPGTRWYGATKAGAYMTQKEAREKGHRPAYGRVCE